MARTNIAAQTPVSVYAQPGANAATPTQTAIDTVNGNMTDATGRELVIVQNTDAAPQTMTFTSASDDIGRTLDISADSIAAGKIAVYGPFPLKGWAQPGDPRKLYFTGSSALLKVSVMRLPAIS